jgi:two-component system chemotaxis response regulator CheB
MAKRSANQPIRVLIAEDSRTQRELLVHLIRASGMIVVGAVHDGQAAVAAVQQLRPDVIAMDINMPGLDGYAATRQIMQNCPTPIVLISSARDASQRTVEALAAGALTVIRKPGGGSAGDQAAERENFITTIRLMSDVLVVTRYPERTEAHPAIDTLAPISNVSGPTTAQDAPQILAIAASTGGPAAVQTLLSGLDTTLPLPILLAQHIARGFVGPLVEWLNTTTALPVHVIRPNERLLPGHVYLAPDDQHLSVFVRNYAANRPMRTEDRYCPSADILFETVAAVYGRHAIGVILTGMGDDGARGLHTLRMAGGHTLAQDEASCVIYGMPRAAAERGAVTHVVPLALMAPTIQQLVGMPG